MHLCTCKQRFGKQTELLCSKILIVKRNAWLHLCVLLLNKGVCKTSGFWHGPCCFSCLTFSTAQNILREENAFPWRLVLSAEWFADKRAFWTPVFFIFGVKKDGRFGPFLEGWFGFFVCFLFFGSAADLSALRYQWECSATVITRSPLGRRSTRLFCKNFLHTTR